MLASQRAPAFSGDYRTSRARISSILLALQILRRGRIPRRKPRQRALLNRQRQMKLRHRSSTMIALQLLRRAVGSPGGIHISARCRIVSAK